MLVNVRYFARLVSRRAGDHLILSLSFQVKSSRLAIYPYTIIITLTSRSLRSLRLVTVLTLEFRRP